MDTTRRDFRRRALAACLAALAAPAWAGEVVIHAARLIDGTGAAPREKVSILIGDDGRIRALQDGYVQVPGAEHIELASGTVLPGLIDAHQHLTSSSLETPLRSTAAATALQSTEAARLTLLSGITSVRDVASADVTVAVALKRAIAKGTVPGPRMWVAGQALGPTGGHMDFSNGMAPDWQREGNWKAGVVDGADAVARAVRWMHQQGVDLIKIAPSGGVATVGDDPHAQLMSEAEIGAAVTTAHALGMKVAAHAHGKQAIENAVRLGVDSIEHGTFADAQTYALMKKHGTWLVGTQTVGHDIYDIAKATPQKLPPGVAEKAIAVTPMLEHNVAAAWKAGVRLGAGSDNFGLAPFGKDTREFQFLVATGVPPLQAILIGTRDNAELIGAASDIGTLQPGRYADIIAVAGDPLQDITELQRVQFVMKGGKVYKRDGAPTP